MLSVYFSSLEVSLDNYGSVHSGTSISAHHYELPDIAECGKLPKFVPVCTGADITKVGALIEGYLMAFISTLLSVPGNL